jgi:transcription antitermination factor NusG
MKRSESPTHELTPAPCVSNLPELEAPVLDRLWLAVFVKSHHEKRISQHFTQRQIENFLPSYTEVHKWANRCKATVELPLFPNYLFVNVSKGIRGRVLEVPGVLSIVCRGSQLESLPEAEIEFIRSAVRLRKVEPHPYLVVGERVRIKSGSLKGIQGVLIRKKDNLRVVITVAQIMQSVAVEVDAGDVEPLTGCDEGGVATPQLEVFARCRMSLREGGVSAARSSLGSR